MTRLLERLSGEALEQLRRAARTAENVDWPSHLAQARGWRAANEAYQADQRTLGRIEMEALLEALALNPPLDDDTAVDLLVAASELFLHTDGIDATVRREGGGVRVDVSRCPIYDRFVQSGWHGVTACGCFARRGGWYDALGLRAEEDLIMNRKWGDPVCEVAVRLRVPLAA